MDVPTQEVVSSAHAVLTDSPLASEELGLGGSWLQQ